MKKNTIRAWIVLAVVLVVYHVVIFALPFSKTPVFFLSWVFTLLAMAVQIYVMRVAFGREDDARSKFYGFPIAKVGLLYLVTQMVLGIAFMALGPKTPIWLPVVLYVVLLGAAVVGFIGTDATRDEIVRQDVKLKKDVSTMRALQSKALSLPALTKEPALVAVLNKFAEAVRYSDPVSGDTLKDIEATLTACVDDLERALVEEDAVSAAVLAEKAAGLLTERNRLCKLSKSAAQ